MERVGAVVPSLCYNRNSQQVRAHSFRHCTTVWMLIKWTQVSQKRLQKLLRQIAICKHSMVPWWDPFSGDENTVADNLSRFKPHQFLNNRVKHNWFFNYKMNLVNKPTKIARSQLQTCIDL